MNHQPKIPKKPKKAPVYSVASVSLNPLHSSPETQDQLNYTQCSRARTKPFKHTFLDIEQVFMQPTLTVGFDSQRIRDSVLDRNNTWWLMIYEGRLLTNRSVEHANIDPRFFMSPDIWNYKGSPPSAWFIYYLKSFVLFSLFLKQEGELKGPHPPLLNMILFTIYHGRSNYLLF